jgi:hypothetical protein
LVVDLALVARHLADPFRPSNRQRHCNLPRYPLVATEARPSGEPIASVGQIIRASSRNAASEYRSNPRRRNLLPLAGPEVRRMPALAPD